MRRALALLSCVTVGALAAAPLFTFKEEVLGVPMTFPVYKNDMFHVVAARQCAAAGASTQECRTALASRLGALKARVPQAPKDDVPLDPATKARILAMMNTSVNPCDDFYQHACGGWFSNFTLPSSDPLYVYSFSQIASSVQAQQLDVLTQNFPFISQFFDTCNDTAAIDAAGWENVLLPLFKPILASSTLQELFQTLGWLQLSGLAPTALVSPLLQTEQHYAAQYELYIMPGSGSFPNYTDPVAQAAGMQVLTAFFTAVQGVLPGSLTPAAAAAAVWSLEANLSSVPVPPEVTSQDPMALINNTQFVTPAAFYQATGFDLPSYLSAYAPNVTEVAAAFLDYTAATLATLAFPPDVPTVQAYLMWQGAYPALMSLPQLFRDIGVNASLAGVNVPGVTDNRTDYCLQTTVGTFNSLLTHEWVVEDFPTGNRAAASELVTRVHDALGVDLDTVSWLDAPTRAAAKIKWADIAMNIGYNPSWDGYVGLEFPTAPGNFVLLFGIASAFMQNELLSWWHTPPNRYIFPPGTNFMEQNSFYYPNYNSINLLAGLMEAPFFSAALPMFLNVAAYGMVAGHELTHGFDNSGRFYNGTGAYVDWWTDAASQEFDTRAQCLIDQYSSYVVPLTGGMHVNGAQTLPENIADGGGISLSWAAYQNLVNGTDNTPVFPESGLSNDQLFFLYFAQNWCTVYTPQAAIQRLEFDVHSPDMYRVIGPLSNSINFAHAYQCAPTDPMGRSLTPDACLLW